MANLNAAMSIAGLDTREQGRQQPIKLDELTLVKPIECIPFDPEWDESNSDDKQNMDRLRLAFKDAMVLAGESIDNSRA